MVINKETLEKYLGYEILDFKVEPTYNNNNNNNNKFSGLEIKIQPKQKIEFIDINFKILPTNDK